jgi:hypothetical protein
VLNYVTCSIYWFLDYFAIRLLCKGGIGWHARAIHWKFPCWSTTQWQTKVTLLPFSIPMRETFTCLIYNPEGLLAFPNRDCWQCLSESPCTPEFKLVSKNLMFQSLESSWGCRSNYPSLSQWTQRKWEENYTTVWLVYMYGETKYWMLCSTKGVGRTAPDTKEYMTLPDGVTVPLGKPVQTGIEHVRVSCPTCILEWCLDLSVPIHHVRLTIKEESTWSQFLFLHLSHMLSCCIEKPVHYHLFMVSWGKCRQAFSTMSTLCTTLPRSVCGMSSRSILTTSADAAGVSEGSRC